MKNYRPPINRYVPANNGQICTVFRPWISYFMTSPHDLHTWLDRNNIECSWTECRFFHLKGTKWITRENGNTNAHNNSSNKNCAPIIIHKAQVDQVQYSQAQNPTDRLLRPQPNRVFSDSARLAMSQSSFNVDAAKVWNAAPVEVKQAVTLGGAKSAIKNYCKSLPI